MASSNIEKFDELVGRIFAELYQQFPLPIRLDPANYCDQAVTECPHTYAPVPTADSKFFSATVVWLHSTGYLTYGHKDPENVTGFFDCVLTAKGLEVLKATPDSLSASLGERLTTAATSGAKEIVRSLTNQILGVGVSYLTKQLLY